MAETFHDIHDRFFRETFSRREVAEGFLRSYLPEAVVAAIEWDTLEIAKDSFIEKALRQHFSDLLYTVRHCGRALKIYLLVEHKSHPDVWVPLQLLRYQVRIWELHRKQNPQDLLPPILPLVLYHGQTIWQTPTRFMGLFGEMDAAFAEYVPDFRYELCDLNLPEPAQIRNAVLSRLVLQALKHIFDPEPKQTLAELLPLVREILDRETALEMLEVVLRYYVQATQSLDEHDIRDLITADEDNTMPTFIDRYIEQGRQQGWLAGREEGKEEGREEGKYEGQRELLLRQINRKFGPPTAQQRRRVKQADGETLLRWSEQMLFAESVEEALR
ncbi:MAG: Rpn family recombination-promoting nuclease/putative transposase [Candidatus Methylumidiphilus sp.]